MRKITQLFGWLDEITLYKRNWEDIDEVEKKYWNNYMVHRFISMHEPYIEVVNIAQKYQYEDKNLYNFYKYILPKQKVYFSYVKSKTSKPQNQELIQILSNHLKLSHREIKEYIGLISKKEITILLQNLGFDEEEIKKLLK